MHIRPITKARTAPAFSFEGVLFIIEDFLLLLQTFDNTLNQILGVRIRTLIGKPPQAT
ncbi:MAG: hypothetical protein KJ052_16820 [Candidatus Hydrogenedentes bacterium]|nr:hypothetical protein [Candidatus Hydrogenedentota bacterium]